MFINQNILDVTSRMTISYTKPCIFMGSKFSRSHRRLRTPSYTFWTFTVGVYEPIPSLSPEGVSSPSCYYPTQVFTISCNSATLLDFVQQYRAHSSINNVVFDFNPTLTLMKCDVPVHMQCDAQFHVNVMPHI